MREAIALGEQGMQAGAGGPFGAVVVKDGKVIGRGQNRVLQSSDPTAHAEVVAIREACASLGAFQLTGCALYSSCEPCPMCLGAVYWARPEALYFAASREDAAAIEFDDAWLYHELTLAITDRNMPTHQLCRDEAAAMMRAWLDKADRTPY